MFSHMKHRRRKPERPVVSRPIQGRRLIPEEEVRKDAWQRQSLLQWSHPELTPNQLWMLGLAREKVHNPGEVGELAPLENYLERINRIYRTNYDSSDAEAIREYIAQAPVTINMKLGAGNPLLIESYRSYWESPGRMEDEGIYAKARRKFEGRIGFQSALSNERSDRNPSEMPRYAALNIAHSPNGGVPSGAYGHSYWVLKEEVKGRSTMCSGDSLIYGGHPNVPTGDIDSVLALSSTLNTVLFRICFAQATGGGKDKMDLSAQNVHRNLTDYVDDQFIEVQVAGAVTLSDVAEVVIDATVPEYREIIEAHETYRRTHGLDFKIRSYHPLRGCN
ncbi:DUF3626 domain-containing protein [Streptomyces sp. NPDC020801]|uniref:DUF3626 domain-containing protein n=1 Tax=unclassified Streptomyces TaxID=2593676 RepID=UPI00378D0580